MADQVIPTGSLALALPATLLAASKPPAAEEKPRTAKTADILVLKGTEAQPADASAKTTASALEELQTFLKQSRSELSFQVDESTGRTIFKLVNADTKQVIRQVPSEEILAMARKLRELATPKGAPGVLVDKEG
jgi:flagellar protein FlaG